MFEGLLNRLAIAVMLLDDADTVIAANRHAHRILAGGDGLVLRAGKIAAQRRREDDKLKALIAGADPWRAGVIARRGGAKPLCVIAAAVEDRDIRSGLPERIARVLLVAEPERRCEVPQSVLISLYGLTHREAILGSLLISGIRLADAAAQLGISAGTARNYLKRIFAKTDTASQAELLALIIRQAGWIDYSPPEANTRPLRPAPRRTQMPRAARAISEA